jgi:hypothetical protein
MSQISVCSAASRIIQPPATISGAVSASGLIKIQTALPHGLNSGDIVQSEGTTGTVEANGQWVISKVDSTHFTLNNSTFANVYVSGGSVFHLGFVAGSALVDNTVFAVVPDFSLNTRLESLSPGSNCRVEWTDATDAAFVTEQPLAVVQSSGTPNDSDYVEFPSFKQGDVPDASRSFAMSGGNVRLKAFISGGAFSSAAISAWITY